MLSGLVRQLRVSLVEAKAFARQAALLPLDALEPVVPRDLAAGDDVVVVMHGLFASAGVLRPLRAHLEKSRLRTASVSYPPGRTVRQAAALVVALLAELPADVRIHLVGHSMGGVVARFVAITAADPRIVQTIALATPFAGIRGARLASIAGTADLEPGSELLRQLRVSMPSRSIPHLSIMAGSDVYMSSPVAHALPDGEVIVLADLGHNSLLFDRRCISLVEKRILERARGAASPPRGVDDVASASE